MTRIAIVGGKLQGTEAAYLARKAGFSSILIDWNEKSPAKGLCDEFLCCDVTKESDVLIQALKEADFVLPANENDAVLESLVRLAKKHCFVLAFDYHAYQISSSKLLSDELIHKNNIPSPKYYPHCSGPYIVKPSSLSGSEGVRKISDEETLTEFLQSLSAVGDIEASWVIQEYVKGPSYSIEVIGKPGNYQTYEVTEIHMDEVYDCKMVTSPCPISKPREEAFRKIAVRLAELTRLTGIMDVEVIDSGGEFKVLEIDARIPSQTPTVVYHTSGVNLIEELRDLFCGNGIQKTTSNIQLKKSGLPETDLQLMMNDKQPKTISKKRYCSFEHLMIEGDRITEHGEHIMSQGGILKLREQFFGSDEVISDYISDDLPWRGTFINWADSEEELLLKRERTRKNLIAKYQRTQEDQTKRIGA